MTASPLFRASSAFVGALTVALLAPGVAAAAEAAEAAPAGGAETAQVAGATAAAMLLTLALFILGLGHRSGRIRILGDVAAVGGRIGGMPGWVAIPAALATVSLLTAAFGFYWDVSLHIDNGRDAGPLANPSHYFILGGLFGIFSAGWFAIVLPREKPGPAAVRITKDWHAPVSGIVLMACASFALAGFPLDDASHRLFGQDVTLWGPTHLMMLGGAALSLLGIMGLLVEGRLAGGAPEGRIAETLPERGPMSWRPVRAVLGSKQLGAVAAHSKSGAARKVRFISACGGFLIALSIFQAEFDYGVPQFRLLFHPVLIATAAGAALVTARIVAGRGGALGAAAFFIVVRGAMALIITGGFGEVLGHFPLYLAEAALVEVVALALGTRRAYRFALVSGALIGTVGVLAEYGWSQIWMPHAWPSGILLEAIALSLPVALAATLIGAFIGGAIRVRPDVAGRRGLALAGVGVVVIAATVGYLLHTTVSEGTRVDVALTDVRSGPEREANATVRFDPPAAAEDADWLTALAWQGGGKLYVEPLRRTGDGTYETPRPIPLHGGWKSVIRLQKDDVLASAPLYMEGDPAIPAAEIPAPARFERALVEDKKLLQRELKDDVPSWLWGAAGAVVGGLTLLILLVLGWALSRIATTGGPTQTPPSAAPVPRREGAAAVA